ncbi:MAG: hypothetical protein IPP54_22615 [Anaerolineales bacterium]|nr:hypothetical protein [Anaerolineales bacterium]
MAFGRFIPVYQTGELRSPLIIIPLCRAGGFGPSLSGLLTAWLIYGREGLQALWDRVRIRRVGGWWLALLVIPTFDSVDSASSLAHGWLPRRY